MFRLLALVLKKMKAQQAILVSRLMVKKPENIASFPDPIDIGYKAKLSLIEIHSELQCILMETYPNEF